jgi:biotin carboxyl carrier protein
MASSTGKELDLEIDGQSYRVSIDKMEDGMATVTVNGRTMEVAIRNSPDPHQVSSHAVPPKAQGSVARAKPVSDVPRPVQGPESLDALMPGVVVKILVEEGKQVATGEVILVLEAMKMENEIRSDRSGTVSKIHASVGQQVQTGDPLISFG